MQVKRYIVKGYVEWQAAIKVGEAVFYIPFTKGGYNGFSQNDAEFITSDPVIQNVIEGSKYFGAGGRITLDKKYTHVVPDSAEGVATMAAMMSAPTPTEDKKKVEVACADDAKEYLATNYGVSRSKMRSIPTIKAEAEKVGVEFTGADFK